MVVYSQHTEGSTSVEANEHLSAKATASSVKCSDAC